VKYHIGEGVYVHVDDPFWISLTTENAAGGLANIIMLKPEMLGAIETIYSREAANITAKRFEENAKKTNQGG
jgi:hypothetical protein